ncbi:hypothetical protein [Sphingobium boeckii]|uniref:Surface antigen n=1 Tax=Sphingobium boeckii TaxID=1082345 RepID=A0A7W9AES0_9SPHN|nr:hypothetical protein [Sphingobium boeckii]MBB5684337.1 surface antigen [Sphingobium boeckii]
MYRAIILSLPLLAASVSTVALPSPVRAAMQDGEEAVAPCKSPKQKKKNKLFGSIIGAVADRTVGSNPITNFIPYNTMATTLTDAIACKLDKDEQKKAAEATEAVVTRSVGASESWTSDTREGVSGTSTVTASTQIASGGTCRTVTDVIIVNGEETSVDKKMCRAPGQSAYVVSV